MLMTKALNKTIILWSKYCNIEDIEIKMVSLEMPIRIKGMTESVTQSCSGKLKKNLNNFALENFVKFSKIRGVY